jgi:cyclophilin family peptidyl-prolyl cis-trans isomerase
MPSYQINLGRSRPDRRFSFIKAQLLLFCLVWTAGSHTLLGQSVGNPIASFHTDLGDIDVALLQDVAPNNVANFLGYVNRGAYDNSFIHRSVLNLIFIIQGGGYKFINNQVTAIPQDPPVVNEFHVSNKRGTLAMAKIAGNPNSATSQWFFNESDSNAPNLDTQNGGFTVFGRIINSTGLAAMDTIASVPIYNAGSPFDQLPLRNYIGGSIQDPNLVHVIWIKVIPQILALTHPSATTVHMQGRGTANATYQLQMSVSPAANTFATFVPVTADSTGVISYDDTNAGTKKFYRLAIP